MSQTKAHSLLEAFANVAIGYGISLAGQLVILPAVGVEASLAQNLAISAGFTAISVVRTYVLRRVFNRWSVRA